MEETFVKRDGVERQDRQPYGRAAMELILAQPLNMMERMEFVILHKDLEKRNEEPE